MSSSTESEETFSLSSAQFSAIIDQSPVGMYVVDAQLRLQRINPKAQPIFATIANPIGRDLREVLDALWPAAAADEMLVHFRHTLATGEPFFSRSASESGREHSQGYYDWELHRVPLPGGHYEVICYIIDVSAHVLAQRALREGEQRLRATFNQAAVGMGIADLHGRFEQVNQKFAEILGYSRAELLQRTFEELTHPDDKARTADQVRRLLHGEISEYILEKRYIRKDGQTVWSLTTVTLLKDAAGQPQQFIGVIEDITRRKQAEQAVAERERELSLIYSSVSDVIFFIRVEPGGRYRFVSINRAFLSATGLSNDQVAGKEVREVIPEPSYSLVLTKYEEAIREKRTVRWEETTDYPSGRKVGAVSVAPLFDESGKCINLIGTVHDVSERKQAEEALRQSEAELRALADSIPQLAWIARADGHVFWYNRGWFDYTGTTLEQMEGWNWESVHDPAMLPEVIERWQQSLQTGTPFQMEFPLRGADGVFRWFLTRVNPVKDSEGRVIRWFGTNTDVDQVKRAEQALRDETRILELLNKAGTAIAEKLDLQSLVQTVTDAATELSGAKFGAFFYNIINAQGESLVLYTLSGAPREAFEKFGLPRNTPVFSPTFKGEGVVRSADITQDPRYGKMAPHHGMPKGHLPVRSYLAVPVISRSGESIGGLFFGHPEPNVFTERSERLIVGVAAQAATAIDNARLYEAAQQQIAERIQTEQKLRESETRLRLSIEATALGTWEYNPSSKLVTLDDRCRELFNFSAAETVDFSALFAAVHPEDRARAERVLSDALNAHSAEGYYIEYRTRATNGQETRWIRGTGKAFFNPQNEPVRLIGTVLDITDLVKARETMAERRGELEQLVAERTASLREAVAQMEEFSYSVSHDLRSPLRAIQGYAEIVLEDYKDKLDPQAHDYLQRISNAGARMDLLTQDVLTYSKIGRVAMRLEPVSLDRLVAETIQQYVYTASLHGGVTVDAPLPSVLGHAPSLVQAVSNLLANAVKFVPKGTPPRVRVWAERRGAEVRLWVEDNGIGIPPEHQTRIWGMFERLNPREHYEGTGIGLAIVRKSIERMGGKVGLESDGKHGSKFWIQLPAAPESR